METTIDKTAPGIAFDGVSKSYGSTRVIENLSFHIKKGERLILLGPSGCGKSTSLRMIAGLEEITGGDVYMDGKRINDIPSGQRDVSMVFQNYALYPHMSVEKNITYALKVQKVPKDEIRKRLNSVLEVLHLQDYAARKPKELSGGQRQRVALARALVKRSDYLLLDEPLSNLDAQLRVHSRKELVKLHQMYGQTFIYVTHDQVEAMTIGQRIALMYQGNLMMLDTPKRVYHRPANVFTARFIGSPAANIIKAAHSDGVLTMGGQRYELPAIWKGLAHSKSEVYFGIRPEHLCLQTQGGENSLRGEVKYIEDYGNKIGVYFDFAGEECISMCDASPLAPGDRVYFTPNAAHIHLFDGDSENSLGYPDELKLEDLRDPYETDS